MLRPPLLAFLLLTLMAACGSEALNSEDTADTMSGHHPEHHHPEPPPTETPADTKPSAPNTPNAPGTPDETAPPSEQSANTTPNDLAPLDAMHVGDEFSIKLRSNSGTGYSWQLAPGTLDERVVEFVTETYHAPEGNLIGATGTEEFVFKAVREGTTTITLHYIRPWETDVEPADIHETEVTILP